MKDSGLATYKRLLSYVKTDRHLMLVAVIGMVAYAATDTAFAALMKPMIDGSFVNRDPESIRTIPLLILLIFVIRGFGSYLSTYFMARVGWGLIKTIRNEMFAKLIHLPSSIYDQSSSGELISKITYNAERVSEATTNALTIFVRDTLTIIGLVGWMVYLNWRLTLVFFLVTPFLTVIVVYISKYFRSISHGIQQSMGTLTNVIEEVIEGQRVVKIFGGQESEIKKFEAENESNRALQLSLVKVRAISVPFIQFIVAIALAGIVYLSSSNGETQAVTAGTFMSFIIAMMALFAPLKRLTTVNAEIQKGIAAGQSIFELLEQDSEKDAGHRPLANVEGYLKVTNLKFKYAEHKPLVIDDISFEVKAGQMIALVGQSGSGKSTLVNLITRFYQHQSGSIELDGFEVNDLSLQNLRSHIAYVGQEVTLFNDTIANNIAYGALRDATMDDIKKAAKAAFANDFIEKMQDGYQTQVGENGVLLSGGQRQRLAIARAFLKDAPILILDEATSALDTESEREVQAGLEKLFSHRTTLVIAHRLSTIEKADSILVFQDGKIAEQGNHQALLKTNGVYTKLHQMQFKEN
jgi:subfamily B ATP-binding cassette protein MsbA